MSAALAFDFDVQLVDDADGLGLAVERGGVTVFCPRSVSHDKLLELLAEQQPRVLRSIEETTGYHYPQLAFDAGSEMWLLGERYEVVINPASDGMQIDHARRAVVVHPMVAGRPKAARRTAIGLYEALALERISRCLPEVVDAVGARPRHVQLFDGHGSGRWGFCWAPPEGNSADCHIAFDWRIGAMPDEPALYLLAHEVAHILERDTEGDHGEEWEEALRRSVPDFEAQQAWLGKNDWLRDI